METLHIMLQILDSQQPNPFFRSPIIDVVNGATHILDVGTGNGAWPRDLADRFPHCKSALLFCGRNNNLRIANAIKILSKA